MAKGFSWREIVLVSAPLLVVVGVFGWSVWQTRFRTPGIALSVQFVQPPASAIGGYPDSKVRFGWSAKLKGGPQSSYHFGWNEHIVAKTRKGAVVVWRSDSLSPTWPARLGNTIRNTNKIKVSLFAVQGLNRRNYQLNYELDKYALPIDTQSLEWHGTMAAVPSKDAALWQMPVTIGTLRDWKKQDGAAIWSRTLPLSYSLEKFSPVSINRMDIPGNKGEVRIEVRNRWANKRSFCRLVAFDGKITRLLWTDKRSLPGVSGDLLRGYALPPGKSRGIPSDSLETIYFYLKTIPDSWGEVTFLCDTVFDLSRPLPPAFQRVDDLDESALNTFQKQTDGYRVNCRLVLRQRQTRHA